MVESALVSGLKKSRFFRNLSEEELEQLGAICREVELPPHYVIFEEYDRAREVYVLTRGEVSLAICEPQESCRQIAVVGEGDLVGWSALLGRTRLTDSATTITPVKAIVFDGQELSDFCAKHPAIGYEFMRQAASALALRLSGTRLQLLEMCGSSFPLAGVRLESD